jgi:hypothetical protein
LRTNRGSIPSASLGEGTLVGLCYADVVEPVERHVAVSGGIQEQTDGCSFAELRVFGTLLSSFAGGTFSRELRLDRPGGPVVQGLGFRDCVECQTLPSRAIESAVRCAAEAVFVQTGSLQCAGTHGGCWTARVKDGGDGLNVSESWLANDRGCEGVAGLGAP